LTDDRGKNHGVRPGKCGVIREMNQVAGRFFSSGKEKGGKKPGRGKVKLTQKTKEGKDITTAKNRQVKCCRRCNCKGSRKKGNITQGCRRGIGENKNSKKKPVHIIRELGVRRKLCVDMGKLRSSKGRKVKERGRKGVLERLGVGRTNVGGCASPLHVGVLELGNSKKKG